MFVLRRITSSHVRSNTEIGDSYMLVTEQGNPEAFKTKIDISYEGKIPNGCYGLVVCKSGKNEPLFKVHDAFIMNDTGKTFENVSFGIQQTTVEMGTVEPISGKQDKKEPEVTIAFIRGAIVKYNNTGISKGVLLKYIKERLDAK